MESGLCGHRSQLGPLMADPSESWHLVPGGSVSRNQGTSCMALLEQSGIPKASLPLIPVVRFQPPMEASPVLRRWGQSPLLIDQQHVSRGGTKASQLWRPPMVPGGDEDAAEAGEGLLFSVHRLC